MIRVWSSSAVVGLLLVVSAGPLTNGPKGAPDTAEAARPSREAQRRFRGFMAEATKAAKKGNHAAAVAAYDRALAIQPNDPGALTDQGWSVFLMKDLARAEAITRRAIAADGDRRRLAAAQYNLGRILEVKGDRAGAIAAYEQSLARRPNRVVREQLAKLDPARAAAADPLKPVPMKGPFAKLADFCKTLPKDEQAGCPAEGKLLSRLGKPFDTAAWIEVVEPFESTCHVALHLERGWFIDSEGEACKDGGFLEWRAESFEVSDRVPGGNREVVLRSTSERSERESVEDGGGSGYVLVGCEGRLTICGVGAGPVPSCIYLQTGKAELCREDGTTPWAWQLEPTFTADGQVEVKGTGKLDADARAYLGRRPLAFP